MSQTTPTLGLPYILPSQAQKHVTHNEALHTLDALVQLTVLSGTISTPPGSPSLGECYLVGAGGAGDWAGQDGAIAVWNGTAWTFVAPKAGWRAYALDLSATLTFDGSDWLAQTLNLQNVSGVGIGTSFDGTNPLSVSGDATLLTHDGTGHQLKLNKATAADTASLLFQNNFSGRAEMGLAGDDDFQIKVSPDGSSFTSALSIDPTSAILRATSLHSGIIEVAPDTVETIPTPSVSGFVLILNIANYLYNMDTAKVDHSFALVFDSGSSPSCESIFLGSAAEDHTPTAMTGTTSAASKTGVSVRGGGIEIENRLVTSKFYSYTFFGGV